MKHFIPAGALVLLLAPFVLTSCRKDVPAGRLIQASGFVVDSVINKKLAGVKVYLVGAEQSFYGVSYGYGPYDSTVSDANGNFSIQYRAEGKSVDYALAIAGVIYGGFTAQDNFAIDVNHPYYPFNYKDNLTGVGVRARQLSVLAINLKIQSNPYDTFYLYAFTPYGEFSDKRLITGPSTDTTILTRCLPNSFNSIHYEVQSQRLFDSGWLIRRTIDSVPTGPGDTTRISKTIGSTYSLPLHPY
ncbi:MAG TPA: hypothetical protein VGM41_05280 [Chitinophagaceae bacterium]|jgi:hypothetical protein